MNNISTVLEDGLNGLHQNCWFRSQHFEEGGGHKPLHLLALPSLHFAPALRVALNQVEELASPHGNRGGGFALKVIKSLHQIVLWGFPGKRGRGEIGRVPLILPMFEITAMLAKLTAKQLTATVVNRCPAVTVELVAVVDAEL